ncbi:hypothetical protein N7462_011447 [Penicillium macrosclerotiorum]|uniref:uncharacterized protein n=1 Tax=Penicillium macrosclerotiorum TaxID=303699 RepID=UPI002547369F|nr:uncharacterized protein N7462_011447 [Penicillium macrosclerotiorum]KAJ5664634.1 hypothetical protein N7462_011447 [Penicillium macrosclerotiorum]
MELPSDFFDYVGSALVQYLILAIVLIATPKRSFWRYVAILCMVFIASRFVQPYENATASRPITSHFLVGAVLAAINMLLLKPLDAGDLAREQPQKLFLSDRLWYAIEQVCSPRAVNTPRQVKNVPAHLDYYTRRGPRISRVRFLIRQTVIFMWQYLVLSIFQALARANAATQAPSLDTRLARPELFPPLEKMAERVVPNLISWFLMVRILIDAHYRFGSIVCVALALSRPEDWPPAFGRMADAYTLRNFWGKFWHQFVRDPFTTPSNFIARDVLHLPRPSILERYTNVFLVFLISGITHVVSDHIQGVPLEKTGSMHFFLSFVLGYMIEDGVQYIWKNSRSSGNTNGSANANAKSSDAPEAVTPLWQKVVGFVWVLAWLAVTSTWFLEPIEQLPKETTLVPLWNPTDYLDLKPLAVIAVAGGAIMGIAFEAEI